MGFRVAKAGKYHTIVEDLNLPDIAELMLDKQEYTSIWKNHSTQGK